MIDFSYLFIPEGFEDIYNERKDDIEETGRSEGEEYIFHEENRISNEHADENITGK